jgi:uncharacterized protein YfaP (DUF2135 family)
MKYFIWLLISSVALVIYVDISEASICEPTDKVIYFGNGILTPKSKAMDSSEIIEERLMPTFSPSEFETLQFEIAYNESNLRDLFEATHQDLQTDVSRFWRILGGIDIMPDWFSDLMNDVAASVDEVALVTSDSLKDQLSNYKTKIAEGKKVLLVAHSQGNFFGNQAYGLLNNTQRQSFGMISVANPDSSVAGDGPYTTLINDAIIWAVIFAKTQAGLLQLPMPPYMVNSLSDFHDILGHSFINAYMVEGSNSDQKITSDMISVLGSLVEPRQSVEPGVITVYLSWGSEPDVDLHVYEPNGSHVFWYTPLGFSGFLDEDDVDSWGPEHYRVKYCDKLEKGVYRVALDYYEGYGPETAIVQVEAGLKVRVFKVPMPSEAYGGPLSPVHLTSIRVLEDANGGYEFQIY